MKTYSLTEAAELICGTNSPAKVKWLVLRLRRGALPGYKAGREWRMSERDVADAIEALRPKLVAVPDLPGMSGLTRTSRRRLAS